jgi:hypothetical protein
MVRSGDSQHAAPLASSTASTASDAADPLSQATDSSTPRSIPDLCKSTRRLAADVRKAYGTAEYPHLVQNLIDSYREIVGYPDQQHVAIVKLKKDVAIFLSHISNDLERQLANPPARPARIAHDLGTLAQRLGPGGGVLAPGGLPAGPAPAGNFGGAVADYGQDLVDLIHAVIQPDIWDVNGGPATVVYYRPLQVLVVRAPGEVHEQLGGALNGLRQ